ncbi:DoxX family membrane protein [Alloactinosynnema sp. L-07]|uniref:DoxX family membrane protein n=1 Tax=Alloactinosynnema sp. L-07 TaxID=1653480 RepID=UPI0012FAAF41|nr:DoxX family membrane protein [Alloactinosynnema sp. L-07]
MGEVTERTGRETVAPRVLGGGFAVLRILFGAIWLSNGVAKAFFNQDNNFDWGFLSFHLINQPTAKSILEGASDDTFQPLRWIYRDFVLANWGFFQWFLTIAEIAAGLLLVFGIASRLGAAIGLALIGPIWVMLLDSNQYFWAYPVELLPLLVLAVVPSGRTFGLDRELAPRFGLRWPF